MSITTSRRAAVLAILAVLAACAAPPAAVRVTEPARATAAPPAVDVEAMRQTLADVHARYLDERRGAVADHNEVAASADPDAFGIAVALVDGRVLSVGDARTTFPLQSLSKVFNVALALEDRGADEVLAKVGTHATGLPYDSLLATEIRATPLQNPMVSSGAIAAVSMIDGRDETERWRRMEANYGAFAGRPVRPIEAVAEAELADDAGSLAKAWVLEMRGLLYAPPEAVVPRYLRGCSVGVTAEDLAVMGATLANGGVNPRTGRRVLAPVHVRGVLAAMITSGMYDDSGPWLYRVGLPAKSGVSGGVVAVSPGRLAIAVYAPRLDEFGNSVRATRVIADLAERWSLHLLEPAAR